MTDRLQEIKTRLARRLARLPDKLDASGCAIKEWKDARKQLDKNCLADLQWLIDENEQKHTN